VQKLGPSKLCVKATRPPPFIWGVWLNKDHQDQNLHVRIARTTGGVDLAHAALNM